MNSTISPCIPSNPDVSGIGVRLAVYMQAALSFIPPILIASAGVFSKKAKDSNTALPMANLVLSASLAFTAFYQTKFLSVHHAVIISLMGWILEGPIMFSSCSTAFRTASTCLLDNLPYTIQNVMASTAPFQTAYISLELSLSRILHGIFGVYLWTNVDTFGGDLSKCTKATSFIIFGHQIPVEQKYIQWVSLSFHSIRLLDGTFGTILLLLRGKGSTSSVRIMKTFAYVQLATAAVALSILVISIEQMIQRGNQTLVSSGENSWGFGQIVAICVIISSARDLINAFRSRDWTGTKAPHIFTLARVPFRALVRALVRALTRARRGLVHTRKSLGILVYLRSPVVRSAQGVPNTSDVPGALVAPDNPVFADLASPFWNHSSSTQVGNRSFHQRRVPSRIFVHWKLRRFVRHSTAAISHASRRHKPPLRARKRSTSGRLKTVRIALGFGTSTRKTRRAMGTCIH